MDFSIKIEICDDNKSFVGYANEELAILAIANIKLQSVPDNFKWSVVHIPTGEVLLNLFKTKREAENFMNGLSELVDLDSLLFLSEGEDLKQYAYPFFEKAYKRFNMEYRLLSERLKI